MEALIARELAPKKPRPSTEDLIRERDSWRRVAKAAMRALRSKDLREESTLQPAGLWILEKDRGTFKQALKGSNEGRGEDTEPSSVREKSAWVWAKPGSPRKPKSFVPAFVFPRPIYYDDIEEKEAWGIAGYECETYAPFRRPFPLEILLLIGSECDKATLGRFTRVSFTFLELFGRKLHHRIDVGCFFDLVRLFPERLGLSSPRLSSHLNLQNLRILEVSADALDCSIRSIPDSHLDLDRLNLQTSSSSLHVDFFTIYFDRRNLKEEASESFDLLTLNPFFLSLLNPSHLVIGILKGRRFEHLSDEQHNLEIKNAAVLLARSSATIISSWTRLETVDLEHMDLFCTETDTCWEDPEEEEDRVFFLGLGGAVEVASKSVGVQWRLVEDWVDDESRRALGGPGEGGWENALQAFALRDDSLIRFGSGERGMCFFRLIGSRPETRRLWNEELERLGEPYTSSIKLFFR